MLKKLLSLAATTAVITLIGGQTMADAKTDIDITQFTKTQSGLQYFDEKAGDGDLAEKGQEVTVHYTGTLYPSGKKFDSSKDRGQPFSFPLGAGRVIKGWDEGVAGMKTGGKRILVIPSDLGYGDRGFPPVIPPQSTLQFEVELLEVSNK